MRIIHNISDFIENILDINSEYVYLTLCSIILIFIFSILKRYSFKFTKKINNDEREYRVHQGINIFINIFEFILLFIIWNKYIESMITLISFISAAVTISLRDIIFNFFSGIYIKSSKIFQIEDRIEINGYKGDVINISALYFEILEVEDDEIGQSTGKIIILPNSLVFTHPVKNYNKAFKYVWDEIKVRVTLDCDLTKNKKELYKIVNSNEIVKSIPTKMKKEVNISKSNYRLYFNKYDPIIYTKVCDKYVELSIRYLMHPKKSRFMNSTLWNNILLSYKNGNIDLYKE